LKEYVYEMLIEVELVASNEAEAQEILEDDVQIWSNETDVAIEVKKCRLVAERDYKTPFEGNEK